MTEWSQRLKTVADDLSNRQHGHREDHTRNTPHPEPEDERDDDEDGIEGEPFGKKQWRYSLALDQKTSPPEVDQKQKPRTLGASA
jgi:hypothetical protein